MMLGAHLLAIVEGPAPHSTKQTPMHLITTTLTQYAKTSMKTTKVNVRLVPYRIRPVPKIQTALLLALTQMGHASIQVFVPRTRRPCATKLIPLSLEKLTIVLSAAPLQVAVSGHKLESKLPALAASIVAIVFRISTVKAQLFHRHFACSVTD